jgi:hypothetical protein
VLDKVYAPCFMALLRHGYVENSWGSLGTHFNPIICVKDYVPRAFSVFPEFVDFEPACRLQCIFNRPKYASEG